MTNGSGAMTNAVGAETNDFGAMTNAGGTLSWHLENMRLLVAVCGLTTLLGLGCASAPRCDVRYVLVTPSDYVWVADNRETTMTRDEVVDRLVSSQGRFEQYLSDEALECGPSRSSPIVWSLNEGDDETVGAHAEARAMEVWSAARNSGADFAAPEHHFNYASRRAGPPHLYRSRSELGDSASIVPTGFDFSSHWLVRAQLPGRAWRRSCPEALDSYMTQSPEDLARDAEERAQVERREAARRDGPAVRMARAALRYTHQGELLVVVPQAESRRVGGSECTLTQVTEPALIPIPHTHADWLVVSFE